MTREEIAIDLESTGLTSNDEITVCGLLNTTKKKYTIFYLEPPEEPPEQSETEPSESESAENTEEREVQNPAAVKRDVITSLPDSINNLCKFDISAFDTEENLLIALSKHINALDNTARLIGFNSSGYDIPTLRSRYMMQGLEWGLSGCVSRDLSNSFQYKFNTTNLSVDGFKKKWKRKFGEEIGADVDSDMYSAELTEVIEEHGYTPEEIDSFVDQEDLDRPTTDEGSLEGIYEMVNTNIEDADPFDSSAEAVEAFFEGDISSVIIHNMIDLYMTMQLTEIVNEYVSSTELKDRPL